MLLLKHLLPEIRVQHLLHQPQTAFQLPELPVRKMFFLPWVAHSSVASAITDEGVIG
mgnify:CR=1 FL=1